MKMMKRYIAAMPLTTALALTAALSTLAGCGGFSGSAVATPAAATVGKLQGVVHGGQQPIGYSNVQIWQVGANGYGTGATALIPSGSYFAGGASGCVSSGSQTCYPNVVSTGSGNFSITGDYTCTPGAELYLTATGGQATTGFNNSAIALMLGFAACGPGNASANLVINEVTTVASVYALTAFLPPTPAATPWNLGTSAGNQTGLVNAFSDIQTLVNVASGAANGSSANVALPTAELNALGNILAACINNPSASSSNCTSLFQATPNADGSTPADTISAALNIARNPSRSVGTLLGLQSATAPFQPTLASASDLTLSATYTGAGIASPSSLAVDASGNVWIANTGSTAANSSVTELTHTGAALSGPAGYVTGSLNLPSAIAIDPTGNAWIANAGNSTVTELGPSGANVGNSPFAGGLFSPGAVTIDGLGYVWIANAGNNSVTKLSSTGSVLSAGGFTGGGLSAPTGIVVSSHP